MVLLASSAGASPGTLDATFGKGGKVVTAFRAAGKVIPSYIEDVTLTPGGDVVAVGWTEPATVDRGGCAGCHFALAMYRPNGAPDRRFGTGGRVETYLRGRSDLNSYAHAVAVQPDGKLVVVGDVEGNYSSAWVLVRYNEDGSLDSTFGSDGVVTTPAAKGYGADGEGVAVQRDGKIVAGGVSSDGHFQLVRFLSNGLRDRSFGTDGMVQGPVGYASAIVLQPDGKILIGGAKYDSQGEFPKFQLARFTASGSLDPSFGTGGVVTTAIGSEDTISSLGLEPDGSIIAGGVTDRGGGGWRAALIHYHSDGSLDTTFGDGGAVVRSLNDETEVNEIAVQPDGKIVVAASATSDSSAGKSPFTLLRYLPTGAVDPSFGPEGRVEPLSNRVAVATAVAVQPDGRIVAGGDTFKRPATDDIASFTVARIQGDAQCVVPSVVRKRLPRARLVLNRADCTVGHVGKRYSAHVTRGRIVSQRPAPGVRRAGGWKVKLVLSKGKRPR
jgi:uncharacterized delta-60 repeat protein